MPRENIEDIYNVLYHRGFLYVSELIQIELMSEHHNDPQASYFRIQQIRELITQKYYQKTLRYDVKTNVRRCDIYLALKAVKNKHYGDSQSLQVSTHCCKDLLIDFIISLSIFTNEKRETQDSILVNVHKLTKIIHYKLIKIIIKDFCFENVITDVIVYHHKPQT